MAVTNVQSNTPRVRFVTGTSASGATQTRTMNLFSSAITKQDLGTAGIDAIYAVGSLLSPLLAYTLNTIELTSVSTISAA